MLTNLLHLSRERILIFNEQEDCHNYFDKVMDKNNRIYYK